MTVHANAPTAGATFVRPGFDRILADGGSLNSTSEIPEIARALAECAGGVDPVQLECAITAACIYADAIVLSDDMIDDARRSADRSREIPRMGAYFLDSVMMWSELFPPAHHFWTALRRYHREYVATMQLEGEIASGKRAWGSCDEDLCLRIVRGKNGPVRAIAAFIAGLARHAPDIEDLEELTLGYFTANQMLDDIRDWRDDIGDGNISLVLRRAWAERPVIDDIPAVGIGIFAGGHVDYVLQLACDRLLAVHALARRVGATRYMLLLDRRLAQFTALAEQLRADLIAQARGANPKPKCG
jgi:hypothetical protein